jgi:tetratricopeptide (TPR) repeat protein
MKWIRSNDKRTFYDLDDDGNPEKILPVNKIRIPVNKENALKYGIVASKDADKIVPYIDITIDRAIAKNTILMLDILNNFDWKRPIYFTGGSNSNSEYIWLKDYLQLDGVSFKFVPIKTPTKYYDENGQVIREVSLFDIGRIDSEKMYKNIQKWNWRNINDGKIYLDEQTKRNSISLRNSLMRLSNEFALEGDTAKAIEVLDLSIEKMPIRDFDHYSLSVEYPNMYYKLGEVEKARATAKTLIKLFREKLIWFSTFSTEEFDIIFEEFDITFRYLYRRVIDQVIEHDEDAEFVKKIQEEFNNTLLLFEHIMPQEEGK